MTFYTSSMLFLGLIAALLVVHCHSKAVEVSLATWNVQHGCPCPCGNTTYFNNTLASIYDLQVVALSDVDFNANRSGNLDQASTLCSRMEGGCTTSEGYYMTNLNGVGANGIAAISNVPMGASSTMLFNSTCNPNIDAKGHGLMMAPVTITGSTFNIFTVHAPGTSGSSQFPLFCQAAQMIDFITNQTNNLTDFHVLLGDFNAGPVNQPWYNYMSYYYDDARSWNASSPRCGNTEPTCSNFINGSRIDSVWVPKTWSSRLRWQVYATPSVGTISDHVPVIAQFILYL